MASWIAHIARDDDILVTGYIRLKIETVFQLSVPSEVVAVCHKFWGVFWCDEWDKLDSHHSVEIGSNGNTVRSKIATNHSAFGTQVITEGRYVWSVQMTQKASRSYGNHPFVGVIKNNKQKIESGRTNCMWCTGNGGYFMCGASNLIAPPAGGQKYGTEPFKNTGDRLQLTLDLEKKTISYCINGKDQGVAFRDIDIDHQVGYRFALGFIQAPDCKITFL